MKNNYRSRDWLEFREKIIELDNMACVNCGRMAESGITLQVHHKQYINGKAPWEYPPESCETLCKGCHAAEHGKIPPKNGWLYLGQDDLGAPEGFCDLCNREIRYVCLVQHPVWGILEVGANCCDSLLNNSSASEEQKENEKYNRRLKRFITSPKWQLTLSNEHKIYEDKYFVFISKKDGFYQLRVNSTLGKKTYSSLDAAKEGFFKIYTSGMLENYFKNKYIKLNQSNN
jgi:hypothetical protein